NGKHYMFFFSSRRRHTRSKRDWSSDVCSSDLAVSGAKNLLGISSPSRVFMKIGQQTGEGMVIGLERQTHAVTSAMTNMVQPPSLPDVDRGTRGVGTGSGYGDTNLYVQAPDSSDPDIWGRRLQESLDLQKLASAVGGI